MNNNQAFSRREERKAASTLPAVSDLGPKITMPRKNNRSAARTVASGNPFWDKRKIERKARKHAVELHENRTENPLPHRLSRKQRQWVMEHLPGWSWAGGTGALVAPDLVTTEHLDDLVNATRLPYVQRAILRLQGLSKEQGRVHRTVCTKDRPPRPGEPSRIPADGRAHTAIQLIRNSPNFPHHFNPDSSGCTPRRTTVKTESKQSTVLVADIPGILSDPARGAISLVGDNGGFSLITGPASRRHDESEVDECRNNDVFAHTGDGHSDTMDASYEAKVLEGPEPLVGTTYEW